MNGAEFKVLRESLGLSLAWPGWPSGGLESERGPKRWQERNEPIPEDRCRHGAARCRRRRAGRVAADRAAYRRCRGSPAAGAEGRRRLTGRVSASFYRAVAARVSWELEGRLKIVYR